ncbi:MAG: T9SS type A sorting domain-containing protein [Bacteroidota bacterium]
MVLRRLTGAPVLNGNWYQLIFVRNGATKDISYYQNGVLVGTFNDVNDEFLPQDEAGYNITLLKDEEDNTEETDGLIAKAAIFNKALTKPRFRNVFNNICNIDLIVLPVSLQTFIAKKDGSKVDLTWTTSSEQNNRGFEVQRSNNGSAYTTIGFVNSVGNTTTEVKYQFTDPSPLPGKNYYRLKQIDIANRATLSAIRILDMSKELQDLQVYPNPSHNFITIMNIKAGNLLYVFDGQGRSVLTKRATNSQESIPVDKLSSGVYILQVADGDGSKRSIRFTKF